MSKQLMRSAPSEVAVTSAERLEPTSQLEQVLSLRFGSC